MSELYATIEERVQRALDVTPGSYDGYLAHDTTAVILADVREALMSDEVIRAGALAITQDPNFGDNTWFDDARNVLTAALDAAGLKGTDDAHDR